MGDEFLHPLVAEIDGIFLPSRLRLGEIEGRRFPVLGSVEVRGADDPLVE